MEVQLRQHDDRNEHHFIFCVFPSLDCPRFGTGIQCIAFTHKSNLYSFELVAPGELKYQLNRTIEKIKVSKTEECNRKKDYRPKE